jgi:hypothetical protein
MMSAPPGVFDAIKDQISQPVTSRYLHTLTSKTGTIPKQSALKAILSAF